MKVSIFSSPGLEAIYFDDELYEEAPLIGSGDKLFLLHLSEDFGFESRDIRFYTLEEQPKYGFPETLEEVMTLIGGNAENE